jgi:hypothetical protein
MRAIALSIALVLFTVSCGQVVNGSRQKIGISSAPVGAMVRANTGESCTAPCVLELPRKDGNGLIFSLPGYQDVSIPLQSETDGGLVAVDVILMVIFFPIGLLALLSLQGGWWKLNPSVASVTLQPLPNADGSPSGLPAIRLAIACDQTNGVQCAVVERD